MWTGMGYPPCSEILPVWCRDGGVDDSLRGLGENGRCAMGDKVKARRDDVFSHSKGKTKSVDMTKLFNPEGTGYIQVLVPQNKQVYETITRQRDSKHKAEYGNAIEK